MSQKTIISLFILLLLPCFLFAQSGKIKGYVKDAKTKEPLIGANILLEGTTKGSSTDIDGNYSIINVPVGTYVLKVSYVGYRTVTVSNVQIAQGLTTEQNLDMSSEDVEVQSVEIVAERPLINKDYTNTMRVARSEDLTVLPTRTVTDAVGMQASVVKNEGSNNLFIRGGRAEEVGVMIDGVSVNNDFMGGQSGMFNSMNQNAVEELQVETGGFNAEYGSAMSGRIGVTTKTATAKYSLSGEFVTDGFMAPEVGKDGGWGYNSYNLSVGGPIIPGRDFATFFLAGERLYQGDNDPRAIGGYKADNTLQGWSFNGKLAFRPLSTMDIKVGGTGYVRKGQNWNNGTIFSRRNRVFNTEHQVAFDNLSYTTFARLTHNIGSNLFYTAQIGYFNELIENGDPKWMGDIESYGKTSLNPILPSDGQAKDRVYSMFDTTGQPFNFYQKTNTAHITMQGDMNLQAGSHLIKAGLEYRYYTVRNYAINTPIQVAQTRRGATEYLDWQRYRSQSADYYGYSYDAKSEYDGEDTFFDTLAMMRGEAPKEAPKHPLYFAFYLQDKVELSDLVLNFGLRVDHFDAKETVVKDPYNF